MEKSDVKIGSHVSMKGTEMYLGSVNEAISYGANAMMIYTGAPQNTSRKPINTLRISEALELMNINNIDHNNIVVHAPYIINFANPDADKRAFAIRFLTEEVQRTAAMRAGQIVLHPGSAVGGNRTAAVEWIAEGVNKVIENTKDTTVKIALETMAGKGNEIGYQFEEIADIIARIHDKTRISVCFDTCHVYDAGYDIKNNLDEVLKHFDQVVGLQKISAIHINDSKNPFHSRKDRHENIGEGSIGLPPLLQIIYDDRFQNIPKILETPYKNDLPPYKEEIELIRKNAPTLKKG